MGEKHDWEHNLCSMGSCSSCCGACWCSPCIYGRTAWRLERYPMDPSSSDGFDWFNVPCIGMFAGWVLAIPCVPIWMQRQTLRRRFNLGGNGCTDCLVSVFCGCCAQVQHENELKSRAEKEMLMVDAPPISQQRMIYEQPSGPPHASGTQNGIPPPSYKTS